MGWISWQGCFGVQAGSLAVAGADFPWVGAAGGFPVGGAVGAVAEGMGVKAEKLRTEKLKAEMG